MKYLDDDASSFKAQFDDCDDRSKKVLLAHLYKRSETLFLGLEVCESPIEKLMLIAIDMYLKDMERHANGMFFWDQQYEVVVDDDQVYRADFFFNMIINDKEHSILVECDGHDFHEKTKEQVARDKKRDRALTAAGYTVLRFSGSEIWKDPYKCAGELYEYIASLK